MDIISLFIFHSAHVTKELSDRHQAQVFKKNRQEEITKKTSNETRATQDRLGCVRLAKKKKKKPPPNLLMNSLKMWAPEQHVLYLKVNRTPQGTYW